MCLLAYIDDQKPTKPKQLVIKKTELIKKLKPLFSQLKPTEIEQANQNRTGLMITYRMLLCEEFPDYALTIS